MEEKKQEKDPKFSFFLKSNIGTDSFKMIIHRCGFLDFGT